MIQLGTCKRQNLCVDCDSEICGHAGDPGADCPKWICDHPDVQCEDCEFLEEYVKWYRDKYYGKDGNDD